MIALSQIAVKLIIALVVLFIGGIIGKLVEKATIRTLHEIELNHLLKKMLSTKILLEEALSTLIKWTIYLMVIIIALKQLGIETVVLSILFFGVVLFCIVGLVLGLKDFIPNAMSGLLIYKKGIIKEGDHIRMNNIDGRVKSVTIVQTIIETKDNDMIYVPNRSLVRELFWKVR